MSMNILVTLDENYLEPLRTMLWSLHQAAEPETPFTVWLIHSHMRPEALESVRQYCGRFGWGFCPCEAGVKNSLQTLPRSGITPSGQHVLPPARQPESCPNRWKRCSIWIRIS